MKTFSFDVVSNATKEFLLFAKVQLALEVSYNLTLERKYQELTHTCFEVGRKFARKLIKRRLAQEAENLSFLCLEMNPKDEIRFKSAMCRIQALSAMHMFESKKKNKDVEAQIEELALNSIVNAMSLIPEFDFDGLVNQYKADPAMLIPNSDGSWFSYGKSGLPDRKDKKAKIE